MLDIKWGALCHCGPIPLRLTLPSLPPRPLPTQHPPSLPTQHHVRTSLAPPPILPTFPSSHPPPYVFTSWSRFSRQHKFLIYALDKEQAKTADVPNLIDALGARARKGECTRLRCLCRDCPLRPPHEFKELSLGQVHAEAELDEDHLDARDSDNGEEEVSGSDEEPEALAPPGKRDMIVELWPWAHPKEFYKKIFGELLQNEAMNHFVYMTTSAHPSALLAASDLLMDCHTFFHKVKKHGQAHGEAILRGTLFKQMLQKERRSAPEAKRVLSTELSFAQIEAPELQHVRFCEVLPDETTSKWRAGFNLSINSDFLQAEIPKLTDIELEKYGLKVAQTGTTRRLTATRHHNEGEILMPVTALLFGCERSVAQFLNLGGNSALMEGPLFQVSHVDAPMNSSAQV